MKTTKKMTLSALMLALALVLPFLTAQIQSIGKMLLPMHLPVLLAAYVVGGPWAMLVGAVAPLLRHLIWGMPPLVNAIGMTAELAAYGLVAGVVYHKSGKTNKDVFVSVIIAMVAGRIVWGIVNFAVQSALGNPFTLKMFMAAALFNAIPGIILQLVAIPLLVAALKKYRLI